MRASEFLIVLCSPRSAQSKWVNREVAFFKRHRDPKKILTLIIDGEPMASTLPGREAEECFPGTLLFKVGEDLASTGVAEDAPLAADARESGDGKRGARLKLAAAMLGLGLDDLVRRDEKRRTARRRVAMAASLALAAVLGGLSIFAFNQRDAAIVARNAAVEARSAAEAAETRAVKARDDAEGLIELILTDLKSDLEGYGTLKSVTQIGNRAIGYYEGQDVKALTPDQLGRRARVLLMLGEADNKRGDLAAALARYETAAATTAEQLARDPENPKRIFDHAQSVFWVGYIAWQRGDHEKAKRQFTAYHDAAQKLVAIDPGNDDYQAELDYAFSNLGTLAMDEGDAAEAEQWFRKSLEVSAGLLEKHPDEIDRVLALGQSYAWVANALNRQGKVGDAERAYISQTEIYERGLERYPNNASVRSEAAVAYYAAAQVLISADRPETALGHALQAVRIADELLASAPENAKGAERASFAHTVLGQARLFTGSRAEARHSFTRAIDIGERLVKTNENVLQWRGKILAQPKLDLARLEALDGNVAEATKLLGETAEALRQIIDAGKGDPVIVRRYCAALAGRARLSVDYKAGWAEIVEVIATHEQKHGPEALMLLAEAYQHTGRPADAARIAHSLHTAGYRHPDFIALLGEFPDLKRAAEGRAN